MTAHYDLISEVPSFIGMRNYTRLFKFVEEYIGTLIMTDSVDENTWSEIAAYINDNRLGIPRGVIRDAIIEVLDLHLLQGLDGDLVTMFKDITGRNLAELRTNALPIAAEEMEKQVRKGNTFFLDPMKMSDVPRLAILVPKVLEVREKQISCLEENPPLVDVYSTYYGFMILTQGSLESDRAGATNEAVLSFTRLAEQLGMDLALKHTQLKYSKNAFGRISDDMRMLLWDLLSVSAAGENNRKRAIDALGERRDSRALNMLHTKLFNTSSELMKRYILKALRNINHASSYEALQKDVSSNWSTKRLQRDVLKSLPRHNLYG